MSDPERYTILLGEGSRPPDSRATVFIRDLQRVVSSFVQDGKLYLELPMDSGTMRLRPAP